uniref:Multiple C2 and transmembrane domain containing 1 n=1 Tax=Paramormyrops kingsleyae TaxID=1676925 RepID=A0A3B3RT12_9TELE
MCARAREIRERARSSQPARSWASPRTTAAFGRSSRLDGASCKPRGCSFSGGPRSRTGAEAARPSNAELPLANPGMYQLDIVLKSGSNLAVRDRGGTSDPYVKFKIAGKEVFRSRTIYKSLNPLWEEKVSLLVDSLCEPLYVKVFDYDFGLQDDFMGSALLYLESLELTRTLDVTLDLKDPQHPGHNLGSLQLAVTLSPKEGDFREALTQLRRTWKRSSKVIPPPWEKKQL